MKRGGELHTCKTKGKTSKLKGSCVYKNYVRRNSMRMESEPRKIYTVLKDEEHEIRERMEQGMWHYVQTTYTIKKIENIKEWEVMQMEVLTTCNRQ